MVRGAEDEAVPGLHLHGLLLPRHRLLDLQRPPRTHVLMVSRVVVGFVVVPDDTTAVLLAEKYMQYVDIWVSMTLTTNLPSLSQVGAERGLGDRDVRPRRVPVHANRAQGHPREHGRHGQLRQGGPVTDYSIPRIICDIVKKKIGR